MNNTQLYLSIGIPTFAVLMAWLSNRSDINRLDAKLDEFGDALRGEMITFRREIHQDLLMLHERVVKVETRQDFDSQSRS
jgi:hypothetical protein